MLARIKSARGSESGFTLIELLIVIVILGVLSGIVVFSVSGITNRGDTAACDANKKTVQVASEAYFAQNNAYAPNIATLATGFLQSAPKPATGVGADTKKGVNYTLATTVGAKPVIVGGTACSP